MTADYNNRYYEIITGFTVCEKERNIHAQLRTRWRRFLGWAIREILTVNEKFTRSSHGIRISLPIAVSPYCGYHARKRVRCSTRRDVATGWSIYMRTPKYLFELRRCEKYFSFDTKGIGRYSPFFWRCFSFIQLYIIYLYYTI